MDEVQGRGTMTTDFPSGEQVIVNVAVVPSRVRVFVGLLVLVCVIALSPAMRGQDGARASVSAFVSAPLNALPGSIGPDANGPDLIEPLPLDDPLPLLLTDTGSDTVWRDVSWRELPLNFLEDQKKIWFFPVQLGEGEHWMPALAVTGVTAGLLSADPYDSPFFDHTRAFRGFDHVFGENVTALETISTPIAFYFTGLALRDPYLRKTSLFAAEAVADSEVVRMVINSLAIRKRPQDVTSQRIYNDTFFRDGIHVGSSFPSGHTIAAFSVATVFARRYRQHRWVPLLAYGVAGTIGFSRVSLRRHFPSDVFLGGALGYAIARYDVLQGY